MPFFRIFGDLLGGHGLHIRAHVIYFALVIFGVKDDPGREPHLALTSKAAAGFGDGKTQGDNATR